MTSLTLAPLSSASLSFKPPLLSNLKPQHLYHHKQKPNQRRSGNVTCRAELSADAPIAVAIGACILNSLVFPVTTGSDDEESDSLIDSTDTRFAVMGIISFIPYFNWLSWVFAWLDTGKRRYAVYALVYLAPYLRSNLSLSPEESWLPIASIVLCIIHIQLEVSIKNGDLQGFQFFSEAAKTFSSVARKKRTHSDGHERVSDEVTPKDYMNLPSAEDESRNEIRGWEIHQKPIQDPEHLNEEGEGNDGKNQ
ncbi:hypothetical protein RHSIM_Rhsim02G0251600 [Rhododendron simsii]|uniref:Uncharacterized protein n=1 Tax=Rhododendron simsii TaxID=118357 RepID=A0A834H9I2_RHOSS|nr:hypothetical protein RHSIM_Rhsim02G0251600 [Rhododendron simsii]